MALGASEIVSIGSAVISAVALGVSVFAVRSARRVAAQDRAADSIRGYLDLSLKYPRFSTDEKDEAYGWYISYLLLMAQEVLAAYPDSARWRTLMKLQLSYHREFLVDWYAEDKEFFGLFGADAAGLVHEVVKSKELK